MDKVPVALTIVRLSDSFHSIWDRLAEELEVRCTFIAADGESDPSAAAVVVAAGGVEDQGVDLLLSLGERPGPSAYLVGTSASHRFGIEAMRRGALDYFALPEDLDLLRRTLASRIEAARERAIGARGDGDGPFAAILGRSPSLTQMLDRASRILPHGDVTVLIGGETGTGKEVLARAIHQGGPRSGGPFVAINCAAIPSALLESELFGHEKGAFTDAHTVKSGLFEEANAGTLFLDEIGHLPLALQGKILRALEEKRVRRVGGNEDRPFDARIIAATHVDLEEAVERGEFRQDLYYRLAVVSLVLPPLRERGADLEMLAGSFAKIIANRYGLPVPTMSSDFITAIRSHPWPGNVRELRHAIERALLLSEPGTLDPREIALPKTKRTVAAGGPIPFPATLRDIDIAAVHASVDMHRGNKSAAARALGISRARLQRYLDADPEDGSGGRGEDR